MNDEAKEPPATADDDVKDKMREALQRKHDREREGEAHLRGHDKASGLHGKEGGGRQFRRKAGP